MVLLVIILRIINLYQTALVIYALLSWFPNARGSNIDNFLNRIVSPYLDIFNRFIPPIGGISFNVMIAYFFLNLVKQGIIVIFNFFT